MFACEGSEESTVGGEHRLSQSAPRMYFQSDIQDQDTEQCAPSVTGIIPRFDFAQAVKLLRKGKTPRDVIEAAERLGNHELKKQIELYVASGSSPFRSPTQSGLP